MRGNTDCEPQAETNPCGLFIEIPTSNECDPGGFCEDQGYTGPESQCEKNGFCVSGPAIVPLEERLQAYQATPSGNVLFGFDDQHTEVREEGGCNDGTWVLPEPRFTDDLGPNGVRLMIKTVPVAIECVMGVNGRGPDGVDSCDPIVAPTPDSRLISFPIQSR
jgi:hypothetical protein